MKQGTEIQWTWVPGYKGETWNPTTGCDRVSPGCAHCYAADLAARLKGMGQKRYQRDGDPKSSGPGFGLTLHPDKLQEPLRWTKPRAVFVNSMSDVFHEEIPDEFIARMFAAMAAAPRHIFMVLTKRPERMRELLNRTEFYTELLAGAVLDQWGSEFTSHWPVPAPLPNVWLGVSIENRRFVNRADLLRETPAAVRFISAEPLLGPLVTEEVEGWEPSTGMITSDGYEGKELDLTDIDWLIVGGESGADHRPIEEAWVRNLLMACMATEGDLEASIPVTINGAAAGEAIIHHHTAFFFKQWGGRTPKAGGRELDGRTWDEFPVAAEAITA